MNLTTQIQFNENIYREQANVQLNLALDRSKYEHRNYPVFFISSLVIGILLLVFLGNGGAIIAGSILVLVGLIYMIAYLNYFIRLKRAKTDFDQQIDQEILRLKEINNEIEIQLTDEHFMYRDADVGSTVRWTLFKSYIIVGDLLLLILNNNDFSAHYIHESHVGTKNFEELKIFVTENIKAYPLEHRYKNNLNSNPELVDN